MTRSEEIAWAAGLFEGEGSITLTSYGDSGRKQVRFSLSSTDKDVVERFRAIMDCGGISGPLWLRLSTKPQWRWSASARADVERLADLLGPWLGERRYEALEHALIRLEGQPPRVSWQAAKTHCPQGHPYAGDNLIIGKRGRHCRTCQNERGKLFLREKRRRAKELAA